MPHDPLSDTDVDAIVSFDRPDKTTALAVEVKRRREKDLATDAAATDAGFQVLPNHRVDPVVVIHHLGARLRAHAEHERSLQEYITHHLQTIGKLNVDIAAAQQRIAELEAPVPLILHCPLCHTRHIDEGEQATKAHRTHACQNPRCGHLWAPAVVATVGVWTLPGCLNVPEPSAESLAEMPEIGDRHLRIPGRGHFATLTPDHEWSPLWRGADVEACARCSAQRRRAGDGWQHRSSADALKWLEGPPPKCPVDARVDRIKRHRSERGAADALTGQPPTEANAEYQAGYVDAAKRAREIPGVKSATGHFDASKSLNKVSDRVSVEISGLSDDSLRGHLTLVEVVDVARRYVAGDLNEPTRLTPRDLAQGVVALADDRELVRKLDAGVGRITEALGFAPGGDFDAMVEAIQRLRARERGERVTEHRVLCPKCGLGGVRVVGGLLEPHAHNPDRLPCDQRDPSLRAPCPKCSAPGVLVDDVGRLAHHTPPGKSDQPLCTHADPGPLWRECRACKAKPGSSCRHVRSDSGLGDLEFHEERCWRPLAPEECERLQLPRVRRGAWHQWGDRLQVVY